MEHREGIEPSNTGFADLQTAFCPVCTRCVSLVFIGFIPRSFQPIQAPLNRHPLHFPLQSNCRNTHLRGMPTDAVVLAFSRAMDECKYWPNPATFRELSGRAVTGDPVAAEAKDELVRILGAMRGPHWPEVKPILAGCFTAPRKYPATNAEESTMSRFGLNQPHFRSLGGPRRRW